MAEHDGKRIVHGQNFIRTIEHYKNGVKVGKREEYDELGKLVSARIYDDKGKIKEDKHFDFR